MQQQEIMRIVFLFRWSMNLSHVNHPMKINIPYEKLFPVTHLLSWACTPKYYHCKFIFSTVRRRNFILSHPVLHFLKTLSLSDCAENGHSLLVSISRIPIEKGELSKLRPKNPCPNGQLWSKGSKGIPRAWPNRLLSMGTSECPKKNWWNAAGISPEKTEIAIDDGPFFLLIYILTLVILHSQVLVHQR